MALGWLCAAAIEASKQGCVRPPPPPPRQRGPHNPRARGS